MTVVRLHTPALYRGLPVTVIGRVDTGADRGRRLRTPLERALGVMTTQHEGSRMLYRVTGHDEAIVTLGEAAHLATRWRTAKDCGGGG